MRRLRKSQSARRVLVPLRRAGDEAGFSFIEVLASLVVTGLIVAVVLPYAKGLATHWWIGEAAVGRADAWMQAVARMSDDVAEAVPLGLGPEDHPMVAFRADADAVMFVRAALGRPQALETVTYAIRSSPAGTALVRSSARFDARAFADADRNGGPSTTLVEGPLRLRLVEITRDGERRRTWRPADGMPAGVELSVASDHPGDVPAAPIMMPTTAIAPVAKTAATQEP